MIGGFERDNFSVIVPLTYFPTEYLYIFFKNYAQIPAILQRTENLHKSIGMQKKNRFMIYIFRAFSEIGKCT